MAYGYESDDVVIQSSSLIFGLNASSAKLVKLEWINNGGAGGAEQEALDIQFAIKGQERLLGYRLFPITKAFLKNNGGEVTDPAHPEFIKADKNLKACITHIMHCFVTTETLQTAFQHPVASFKEYCKILMSLLPKDYDKIKLDLFVQYQWSIKGDAKQTYLEIPKTMNSGRWICKAIEPVGAWKVQRDVEPDDNKQDALKYVDEAGNVHPFVRNGYFVNKPWSNQQKDETVQNIQDVNSGQPSVTGAASVTEVTTEDAAKDKASW